jgi:excisionase family DNA binding protein
MSAPLALSVDETAERLGLSPWMVRQAIGRGQLPVLDPEISGRRVLIPVAALEARIAGAATYRTEAP